MYFKCLKKVNDLENRKSTHTSQMIDAGKVFLCTWPQQ